MHGKAADKLGVLVVGMLKNCRVQDSWFDWDRIEVHFQSVAKEISRYKSAYIRERDVYSILTDLISAYIREHSGLSKESTGMLQDLVGEPRLLELADLMTRYLSNIPHPVTAELVVSSLISPVAVERKLGKATSAGCKNKSDGVGFSIAALTNKYFYLSFGVKGAASWTAEAATNRLLLSSLKIMLHHAIDQNAIRVGDRPGVLQSMYAHTHQIAKANIKTIEDAIWHRESTVELPLEICILLEKMSFDVADKEPIEKLLECLVVPAKIIESDSEESIRLKAAIEWSFDSLTAENETMAFLKACIGLEALLGEGDSGSSLTESLSDRCAYLIATSIKSRKSIKERFKDLYKIRSKIVHGAINHLDRENRIQLEFARHFLRGAIRKELQYIMPQLR